MDGYFHPASCRVHPGKQRGELVKGGDIAITKNYS